MLRRAVGGFFPKPKRLKEFDWLSRTTIARLKGAGIENTQQFFDAATTAASDLAECTGLTSEECASVAALSDLSRVQWTSPTFARVLVAAGIDGAAALAEADADALCAAVAAANEDARYYRGKVGLRDIKRLIEAARYVAAATQS